ncbi:hypothetical protein KJ819_02930 [Patescibacteria group bacterium]|nr:hypothetical protein [Patescibacteria group bacterium]MBU1500771.1 hypothetical protein [Patescibacteria group bacterium]MBU2080826.1 hypothetical protein [Patescibacteria group bacterium]MBU2123931.1 hypothetical protein [Patescibacteria group bacterium]MBU2194778.1 hypothetical protein [Patescibacteria group bacterium]
MADTEGFFDQVVRRLACSNYFQPYLTAGKGEKDLSLEMAATLYPKAHARASRIAKSVGVVVAFTMLSIFFTVAAFVGFSDGLVVFMFEIVFGLLAVLIYAVGAWGSAYHALMNRKTRGGACAFVLNRFTKALHKALDDLGITLDEFVTMSQQELSVCAEKVLTSRAVEILKLAEAFPDPTLADYSPDGYLDKIMMARHELRESYENFAFLTLTCGDESTYFSAAREE